MRFFFQFVGATVTAFIAGTCGATPPIPKQSTIDYIQLESNGALFAAVGEKGLYRRTAERDWELVLPQQPLTDVKIYHPNEKEWMLAAPFGGPQYRSLDQGQTWAPAGVVKGLVEFDDLGYESRRRLVATTAKGIAYLLNRDRLMISEDLGATWNSNLVANLPVPIVPYAQSIAANDAEIFVLSGNTLHRSQDRGRSWMQVPQTSDLSPVRAGIDREAPVLKFAPNGALLALGPEVVSQRIFVSKDGGRTWKEERFGLDRNNALVLETYGENPEDIYFFMRSNGPDAPIFREVYRMEKDGKLIKMGIDPNIVSWVTQNFNGEMFMLSRGGEGVMESKDGGRSWVQVSREAIKR